MKLLRGFTAVIQTLWSDHVQHLTLSLLSRQHRLTSAVSSKPLLWKPPKREVHWKDGKINKSFGATQTVYLLKYTLRRSGHQRLHMIKSNNTLHNEVIKWKHFPCYWPFVREIHRWGFPLTKASDTQLSYFLSAPEKKTIQQAIEMPVIWDARATSL